MQTRLITYYSEGDVIVGDLYLPDKLDLGRRHPAILQCQGFTGIRDMVQPEFLDEMAASMALSGDLKRVRAMILADMIGSTDLKIKRDTNSTPWLTDLIWATASRLGYGNVFVNEGTVTSLDDHLSFIRRGVPGCDIIDFDISSTYWHTPQDTLDKVDPHSLAVVGHVFVETLPALEKRAR